MQLGYLEKHLSLGAVHHAALLPEGLAKTISGGIAAEGADHFPIVLWEDLLDTYRAVRSGDDYFMSMLDVALSSWPILAAKPAHSGEFGRPVRSKSAAWSDPNRPPSPVEFGHRSRRRRIDDFGVVLECSVFAGPV
ncbi:MAG: hypothetical protein ACYC6T_18640, partial [Thermoleophilia bacterium]